MSDSVRSLQGPHFVLTTEDGAIHGDDTPENRELVRRIHACVNACEGISTEELEKGIIQDMRWVLANVVPLLQNKNETDNPSQTSRPIVVNGPPIAKRPLQDA